MKYTCKSCGWSGFVVGRKRCLACNNRRTVAWRKNNPEKYKAQNRRRRRKRKLAWKRNFPGRRAAERRRAYRNNPGTKKASNLRRLLWLKAGDVTKKDLQEIHAAANGLCAYCKKRVVLVRFARWDPRGFDHVLSRANGGKHTKNNIVVCCRQCNELKG